MDPSLSLRRWGEAQKRNDKGFGWAGEGTCTVCVNEFRAVGVGWTGGKSRCRGNVESVVVDNVSCLPDLAQGTSYMRAKPLHQTMCTLLLVSQPSAFHPATLVADSAVQGITSACHLNNFFPFKDADRIKQEEARGAGRERLAPEDTLYYMFWRDGVREEGDKGVSSIPVIRCKVRKVGKEAGCEIGNIGEEVHIGSAVLTAIR